MNKQVIIAVDVDDVLAETAQALIDWSNQQFGSALTLDHFSEQLTVLWGVDHAEAERRWLLVCDELLPNVRPLTTAADINRNRPDNVQLLPLTSRRKAFEAMTDKWVQQHYPGIFLPAKSADLPWQTDPQTHLLTKAAAVTRHGAVGIIDDQPKHVLAVHSAGGTGICYGDYHWNRDLPDYVPRGHTWDQIWSIWREQTANY